MPVYDYKCKSCEQTVEEVRSINDDSELLCGVCGDPMIRIITTCNFALKGGGWGGADLKEKNEREKKSRQLKEKMQDREKSNDNDLVTNRIKYDKA